MSRREYARGDFCGAPIVGETLGSGVMNKVLHGLPFISHSKYWKNPQGKDIIVKVIDNTEKRHGGIGDQSAA